VPASGEKDEKHRYPRASVPPRIGVARKLITPCLLQKAKEGKSGYRASRHSYKHLVEHNRPSTSQRAAA